MPETAIGALSGTAIWQLITLGGLFFSRSSSSSDQLSLTASGPLETTQVPSVTR